MIGAQGEVIVQPAGREKGRLYLFLRFVASRCSDVESIVFLFVVALLGVVLLCVYKDFCISNLIQVIES